MHSYFLRYLAVITQRLRRTKSKAAYELHKKILAHTGQTRSPPSSNDTVSGLLLCSGWPILRSSTRMNRHQTEDKDKDKNKDRNKKQETNKHKHLCSIRYLLDAPTRRCSVWLKLTPRPREIWNGLLRMVMEVMSMVRGRWRRSNAMALGWNATVDNKARSSLWLAFWTACGTGQSTW